MSRPDDSFPNTDGSPAPESTDDLIRQRDEYLDQLQRSRAEFANFQKRSRAQVEIDRQYAAGALATDLLGVLDNFERAIEAAKASGDASIVNGLDLVYKQLLSTLAKHGVEPIEAEGQPFDPSLHEAILHQASADAPEGTVLADYGRGYRLRDRVLRPSKVSVSKKPD
jgi:molecular chaperone GrpE